MYIETNIVRIKEILMTSQNNLLSRDIISDEDSLKLNITNLVKIPSFNKEIDQSIYIHSTYTKYK